MNSQTFRVAAANYKSRFSGGPEHYLLVLAGSGLRRSLPCGCTCELGPSSTCAGAVERRHLSLARTDFNRRRTGAQQESQGVVHPVPAKGHFRRGRTRDGGLHKQPSPDTWTHVSPCVTEMFHKHSPPAATHWDIFYSVLFTLCCLRLMKPTSQPLAGSAYKNALPVSPTRRALHQDPASKL